MPKHRKQRNALSLPSKRGKDVVSREMNKSSPRVPLVTAQRVNNRRLFNDSENEKQERRDPRRNYSILVRFFDFSLATSGRVFSGSERERPRPSARFTAVSWPFVIRVAKHPPTAKQRGNTVPSFRSRFRHLFSFVRSSVRPRSNN